MLPALPALPHPAALTSNPPTSLGYEDSRKVPPRTFHLLHHRVTSSSQHPPAAQQRVTIEELPDNTPPEPPPPRVTWQDEGPLPTTVLTPTLTARAAFANPSTADRATQLAARIASLEAELLQSRNYHSNT